MLFRLRNTAEKPLMAMPLITGFILYMIMLFISPSSALQALPAVTAMFVLTVVFTEYFSKERIPQVLLTAVLTLMMAGILFGYLVCDVYPNVSSFSLITYLIAFAVGVGAYLLVPFVMKQLDHKYTPWLMLLLAAGIYAVLLTAGYDPGGHGTKAWINIGRPFQLTELLKPVTALFYASVLPSEDRSPADRLKLASVMFLLNAVGSLAIKEMGTFTILLLSHMLLVLVLVPSSELKTKHLAFLIITTLCLIPACMFIYLYLNPYYSAGVLHGLPYLCYWFAEKVYDRFSVFLRINKDIYGEGFQIYSNTRSLLTSRLIGWNAAHYIALILPESDVAFISFTALFGFIPAAVLSWIYYLIYKEADKTARMNVIHNRKQAVLVYSAGVMIFIQAMLHIAGSCNLAPFTGITLPLVSYGGASHMVTFILLAVIVRVSSNDRRGLDEANVYTMKSRGILSILKK